MNRGLHKLGEYIIPVLANVIPYPLARNLVGQFAPIFMLHRIKGEGGSEHGHDMAFIEQCLAYVRKHRYHPISLLDYCRCVADDRPLPEKSVIFTIDDGFREQCTLGGPLFSRYDVPLTCFAITDFIDRRLWPWDDQIAYVFAHSSRDHLAVVLPGGESLSLDLTTERARHEAVGKVREKLKTGDQSNLYDWLDGFYTAAEVSKPGDIPEAFAPISWQEGRDFIAQGHHLAPHTRSHRILSRLSDEDSRDEIAGSIRRMGEMAPGYAPVFAYPTGRAVDFTDRDTRVAEGEGMLCTVSTEARAARLPPDIYTLPRFGLPDKLTDFIQYISSIEVVKESVRKRLG